MTRRPTWLDEETREEKALRQARMRAACGKGRKPCRCNRAGRPTKGGCGCHGHASESESPSERSGSGECKSRPSARGPVCGCDPETGCDCAEKIAMGKLMEGEL